MQRQILATLRATAGKPAVASQAVTSHRTQGEVASGDRVSAPAHCCRGEAVTAERPAVSRDRSFSQSK